VTNERMTAVLSALELAVRDAGADRCVVGVPTFRVDLENEADLIEEVARIHGLHKVPAPAPRVEIVPGVDDSRVRAVMMCRENLVALGLTEIMNYSLVSERLLDLFDPSDAPARVALPNPVSADQSTLRTSLIPQMVASLGGNRAHQVSDAALFEIGRVFRKNPDGTLGEEERAAVGLMGAAGRSVLERTRSASGQEVFQWMRGVLEAVCVGQRIVGRRRSALRPASLSIEETKRPFFEAGMGVRVSIEGQACGVMGVVAEAIRREWRLVDPVGVMELRLDALLVHASDVPSVTPPSAFPSVMRDVAVIVEESVRHDDILAVVARAAPPELAAVRLFDVYRSRDIGPGRKSMAFSFTYQSAERTLTDEEANGYHDRIRKALAAELGAQIREK
jgi:phenylalanyl-tRNA synthetase beta chain